MRPASARVASHPQALPPLSRILFVTPSFAPFLGGAATFAEVMARRLAAAGHGVSVLTTNAVQQTDFWQKPDAARSRPPAREGRDGFDVIRLELAYPPPMPYAFGLRRRAGYWLHGFGRSGPLARRTLQRLARQMPPLPGLPAALEPMVAAADLVQVFDSSWDGLFTQTVFTAVQLGKPCVVAPLMHLGTAAIRAAYRMAHQLASYRSAEAVLALSPSEARTYADLGVPAGRIHRIDMGIDVAAHDGGRSGAVDAFRRSRNLTRPILAFLGANTYDKGAFSLALAAAQLAESGLDVDAVYAGPLSELLAAFVRGQNPAIRAALRDRLHILGAVDEETKCALLESCDLLALPSQVDSFGIVFLEAWLHGKPVIGAAAGGIPDLVRHEETGLLVPFGDVPALADAIRRLITEQGLASRLGAAGRREVLEHYTWDHTYRALLQVYAAVLPAGGPESFPE
jgi:glycosyltransferase involved in cell wall biosynthesis